MIIRILKLKLTHQQAVTLNEWLWCLTGLYNWTVKRIAYDAHDKIYHSRFDCQNWIAGHSLRMEIPSHVMQGIIEQVHNSWQRCLRLRRGQPRLKGQRNKLNSIPFPDVIKPPRNNRIAIPGLGKVKYHKQDLPDAKIKCGRIVKRASGWYLCLWLDCEHKFPVKDTTKAVGIDPGFSTLLTLSDGTKIANPRELRTGAKRLAQAQRGGNKQLVARLQERQANRRQDRNHKISRKLVEEYATICYSDDNFKGIAHRFGKSIGEAGLGQLIGMLDYKCRTGGRTIIPVKSFNTTMTCSACGTLTGPTGLDKLAVRHWVCPACGADHDRDINAAKVVLKVGLGMSHEKGLAKVA